MGKESFDLKTAVEQIIGREGETATLLSRCLVSLTCCRKITPKRWRESTKIKVGDSSYEKDVYGRADRQHFTRF